MHIVSDFARGWYSISGVEIKFQPFWRPILTWFSTHTSAQPSGFKLEQY